MRGNKPPNDNIALDITGNKKIILGISLDTTNSMLMIMIGLKYDLRFSIHQNHPAIKQPTQTNNIAPINKLDGEGANLQTGIKGILLFLLGGEHLGEFFLFLNCTLEGHFGGG
jgi:hypothetical protein